MTTFFQDTYCLSLSPMQRRILSFLYENNGATLDEITLQFYDFGKAEPEIDGRASMRVAVSSARKKLETVGWTIPRHGGGRAAGAMTGSIARYTLERMTDA